MNCENRLKVCVPSELEYYRTHVSDRDDVSVEKVLRVLRHRLGIDLMVTRDVQGKQQVFFLADEAPEHVIGGLVLVIRRIRTRCTWLILLVVLCEKKDRLTVLIRLRNPKQLKVNTRRRL